MRRPSTPPGACAWPWIPWATWLSIPFLVSQKPRVSQGALGGSSLLNHTRFYSRKVQQGPENVAGDIWSFRHSSSRGAESGAFGPKAAMSNVLVRMTCGHWEFISKASASTLPQFRLRDLGTTRATLGGAALPREYMGWVVGVEACGCLIRYGAWSA